MIAVAPPSDPWYRLANGARRAVMRGAAVLPSTPRALLAGFVLGDTRAIPDDVVVAFRAAGLEPSARGVGRQRRVRARRWWSRCSAGSPRWVRLGRRSAVLVGVRGDDPLGALGRAGGGDGGPGHAGARDSVAPPAAPRVLVLGASGPARRSIRSCSTRSGSCCRAALRGHRRGSGAESRRGCPARRWLREALGVTTAAQIGVSRRCCWPRSGSSHSSPSRRTCSAAPFVGPLTIWGLVASTVGGSSAAGVARGWSCRPSRCCAGHRDRRPYRRRVRRSRSTAALPASRSRSVVGAGRGPPRPHSAAGRLAARGRHLRREGQRSDPA